MTGRERKPSGRPVDLSVQSGAELGPAYPQGLKPRPHDPESGIPAPTLHIAHVGAMEARLGSQGLLAHPGFATEASEYAPCGGGKTVTALM
jgi:hypothetical protein